MPNQHKNKRKKMDAVPKKEEKQAEEWEDKPLFPKREHPVTDFYFGLKKEIQTSIEKGVQSMTQTFMTPPGKKKEKKS